jgi:2-aminoadipate transaminase
MFKFTPPFEAPTGSPIRELFKYLGQPGMISFAGGYPASDLFDRAGLDAAAARASQQSDALSCNTVRPMACRFSKRSSPG